MDNFPLGERKTLRFLFRLILRNFPSKKLRIFRSFVSALRTIQPRPSQCSCEPFAWGRNSIKHQAIKTYRRMEIQLHAFLNSAVNGGE
jgi:hypothetical protein